MHLCHKVMSLLFNTLSRFVIAFLSWSKCLNFKVAVTVHSDFGAQEKKVCHCFPIFFPSICHAVMELDDIFLVFWMLSFKPAFSLSFLTVIKRLFSSSLLPVIRVVSSAYLRLLRNFGIYVFASFNLLRIMRCQHDYKTHFPL